MMMYNWVVGLSPLSCIVKNTKEQKVSATGTVSLFSIESGRNLLCDSLKNS
jgi:hypothetical protein